ncbi:MAG TPA: class I SAM-dependent methyltransferase [Terriglobales bacterium]|nr:class I SAM-dependent methyltransferase [Terriglobales bacterium]
MGGVSQSLARMLRGGSAASAGSASTAEKREERISRRSSGLTEFTRAIAGEEGLRILDLGPTSPANIAHLTELGHKVYNEDVLKESLDPAWLVRSEDGAPIIDADRFFSENLAYSNTQFDAILCWDVCDYLHEALVKPMVNRIHRLLKTKGVLLAFFHTRDAGPDAPYYRYHIVGADSLELQYGPRFRLQRVFNNRHIENLFRDFASLKFFLARDNVREILVVR